MFKEILGFVAIIAAKEVLNPPHVPTTNHGPTHVVVMKGVSESNQSG